MPQAGWRMRSNASTPRMTTARASIFGPIPKLDPAAAHGFGQVHQGARRFFGQEYRDALAQALFVNGMSRGGSSEMGAPCRRNAWWPALSACRRPQCRRPSAQAPGGPAALPRARRSAHAAPHTRNGKANWLRTSRRNWRTWCWRPSRRQAAHPLRLSRSSLVPSVLDERGHRAEAKGPELRNLSG